MIIAPETTASTSAFHDLGCMKSCCQAAPMCQEASSEDDDIRSSEKITSDHDSASNIHQGGTDATDAMDVFSTLLTGLSTANMLIGQGTDIMLKDVSLIRKHWERLVTDKENSKPIAAAEKHQRTRLRKSTLPRRSHSKAVCHRN